MMMLMMMTMTWATLFVAPSLSPVLYPPAPPCPLVYYEHLCGVRRRKYDSISSLVRFLLGRWFEGHARLKRSGANFFVMDWFINASCLVVSVLRQQHYGRRKKRSTGKMIMSDCSVFVNIVMLNKFKRFDIQKNQSLYNDYKCFADDNDVELFGVFSC